MQQIAENSKICALTAASRSSLQASCGRVFLRLWRCAAICSKISTMWSSSSRGSNGARSTQHTLRRQISFAVWQWLLAYSLLQQGITSCGMNNGDLRKSTNVQVACPHLIDAAMPVGVCLRDRQPLDLRRRLATAAAAG